MNKWTPGPWKAGTFAEMECDISADGWMGLAVVNSNEDDGLAEQAKANARLIAAAPELVEALDALVNFGADKRLAMADARALLSSIRGD